jgi:hypothetical protein
VENGLRVGAAFAGQVWTCAVVDRCVVWMVRAVVHGGLPFVHGRYTTHQRPRAERASAGRAWSFGVIITIHTMKMMMR